DRVPPVHREECPGRPERRDAELKDVVQVAAGEVIKELREDYEVELARWPVPGNGPVFHRHVREVRGVLGRGLDRGGRKVARQQAVTAPGQHPGEHTYRAAWLEGVAVAPAGQHGGADRVLPFLVPAGAQA